MSLIVTENYGRSLVLDGLTAGEVSSTKDVAHCSSAAGIHPASRISGRGHRIGAVCVSTPMAKSFDLRP